MNRNESRKKSQPKNYDKSIWHTSFLSHKHVTYGPSTLPHMSWWSEPKKMLSIAECQIDFSFNPSLSTVPRRSWRSCKQVIFNLWLPFPEAPKAGQRYSLFTPSAALQLRWSHLVPTLLSTQPARACVCVVPPRNVDMVSWLLSLESLITKPPGNTISSVYLTERTKSPLSSLFKGPVHPHWAHTTQ